MCGASCHVRAHARRTGPPAGHRTALYTTVIVAFKLQPYPSVLPLLPRFIATLPGYDKRIGCKPHSQPSANPTREHQRKAAPRPESRVVESAAAGTQFVRLSDVIQLRVQVLYAVSGYHLHCIHYSLSLARSLALHSHLTAEAEGEVIILAAEGESTLRGSTTGPSTMLMSDSRCSGAIIAHPGLESWSRIARCACSRASRLRVSGYPVECTNLQVEQGAWNDSRSRRSTRQPRQTFDDFSDSLVVHVIHREVRCEGLPDRRATTRAAIATVSVRYALGGN